MCSLLKTVVKVWVFSILPFRGGASDRKNQTRTTNSLMEGGTAQFEIKLILRKYTSNHSAYAQQFDVLKFTSATPLDKSRAVSTPGLTPQKEIFYFIKLAGAFGSGLSQLSWLSWFSFWGGPVLYFTWWCAWVVCCSGMIKRSRLNRPFFRFLNGWDHLKSDYLGII